MFAYLDGASLSAVVALIAGGGAAIWNFLKFKVLRKKISEDSEDIETLHVDQPET